MLVYPQLNTGGSSFTDLQEQYLEAYKGLKTALESVAKACPHGRDFVGVRNVIDGADMYRKARTQWAERLEILNALVREYEDLMSDLNKQQKERDRIKHGA